MGLSKELDNIQNPALGGYLLAVLANKYYESSDTFPVLQLLFVAYPLIYIEDIYDIINSTNRPTGLRGCIDKLKDKKNSKNDMVLHIQSLVEKDKLQILSSIRVAMLGNMISIDDSGLVIPLDQNIKKVKIKSREVQDMKKISEKIGEWFSELTFLEISQIMKVRF